MLKYASWEGCAVIIDGDANKAWVYGKGQWHDLNIADAFTRAKLLTEDEYNRAFPNTPPLPLA